MNVDVATAPTPLNPVATHLRQCGIEKVLLIDDAFDPFDVNALQDEIGVLWDQIIRSDELKEDLSTVRPNVDDRSQIDKELIDELFKLRESLPKLGPVCTNTLFAEKLSKIEDLEPLRAHFDAIGIEVLQIGSDDPLPDDKCKLIFLDYSLGPDVSPGAVENARSRAVEIYGSIAIDEDKPFIVLMSSKPNADLAQEDFRDRSGLLGGLFAFLKKVEFRNREKFNLHLVSWALGMPTRHTIQRFVESLDKAATVASTEFSRHVRALGVEDYANIQNLSLQQDGHPLGDYMLWLYKSLFGHLLHDQAGVLAEQQKLDALTFEHFTPSQSPPSTKLAEIYRYALTEPGVGPLGAHPRATEGSTQPYLQLGDMFFKSTGGNEVLIVLSAACDLLYAPGAKRGFPSEHFVLFEHGELQPIADEPRDVAMRTELFHFNNAVYRILWDHGRAVWKEYGAVEAWLTGANFVRQARMSLPYALELQKSFANHITRIGMPVKPPLFLKGDVEVVAPDNNGSCSVIAAIAGGAQIVRRWNQEEKRDEELFVLTVDCVGQIVASLQQVFDRINESERLIVAGIAALKASNDPDKAGKLRPLEGQLKGFPGEKSKVNTLLQVYEQWRPLVQKLQTLPAVGQRSEIDKKLLWVFRNAAAAVSGKYAFGPPIVLHLKTSDPAQPVKVEQQPLTTSDPEGSTNA